MSQTATVRHMAAKAAGRKGGKRSAAKRRKSGKKKGGAKRAGKRKSKGFVKLKKGSAAAKAWGKKMQAARKRAR